MFGAKISFIGKKKLSEEKNFYKFKKNSFLDILFYQNNQEERREAAALQQAISPKTKTKTKTSKKT